MRLEFDWIHVVCEVAIMTIGGIIRCGRIRLRMLRQKVRVKSNLILLRVVFVAV